MAVRLISDGDMQLATMIAAADPHANGVPCWSSLFRLPAEAYDYTALRAYHTRRDKEIITNMAIRVVEEKAAPARMFARGTVSTKADYADAMTAINSAAKGQAIIVDMDVKAWVDDKGAPIERAETLFASNLRRYFEGKGLPLTAYQSGKMQITIRRRNALDPQPKGKKK